MQEEALTLCRALEDAVVYVGHMLYALGIVAYRQYGNLDEAEAYFIEALHQFQESGDPHGAGIALANLGRVTRDRGNYAKATALYAEGLTLHWADSDSGRIAACLNGLGIVAALAGQSERAARLCGAAEALRETIGASIPRHRGQYERTITTTRALLGEQAFAVAWAAGRSLSLAEAVAEALQITPADTESRRSGALSAFVDRYRLTARELDVLRLLPRGLTNREIGGELFIGQRTAATHVQNILTKLDVHSRTEAVALAKDHGLV